MSYFINYNFYNPKLKFLSEKFNSIKEEYLINRDKLEFKDFTHQQNQTIIKEKKGFPIQPESYFLAKEKNLSKKGWHVGGIFYDGYLYNRNADLLPTLIETIKEIEDIGACGLNILDPGISLDWHNDNEYYEGVSTLRVLWGLDVPVEKNKNCIIQMKSSIFDETEIQTEVFEDNKFYCFWPSTYHRVENNLSYPRTVLTIDLFTN